MADPFADGANPFASIGYVDGPASAPANPASTPGPSPAPASDSDPDALPPLTVTRGSSSLPPAPAPTSSSSASTPVAGAPPADPFAGGANPFEKIGFADDPPPPTAPPAGYQPGVLGNSSNDGWISGAAKGTGTTIIKGLAHAPGFVGDIGEFADALTEIPEYVESKITGQPFADVVAKRNALAEQSRAAVDAGQRSTFGFSLDPRHYFPSGSQVAAPILTKTGAYEPTTALGRYASAAGEAALGGLGPGGGAIAGNIARDVAPSVVRGIGNMARGAAEHATTNAAAGIASQAASDATGGDPLAAAMAGIGVPSVLGAAHGFVADRPARRAAAVIAQGTADPQAALEAIRNRPEAIPGVDPTTAQVTNDPGVYAMQTAAAGTDARGPAFDARQRQQSRGLGDALDALKPGGDPQQVAGLFARHFDDIGDRTQAIVDGHLADAQSQADALRGQGLPVDAYGTTLRNRIEDAEDARGKAEGAMWDTVDPDGRLTNDLTGIKAANAQIYGSMPAADRAFMSPNEATFSNLISGYGDVEPFRQVTSLKSNLASAMRQELRTNGSTPAYARMARLMRPVQAALNDTVARKAAADNAAVAAGTMAPEDTLGSYLERQAAEADARRNAGADVGARAVGNGAGAPPGFPSGAGSETPGQRRLSGSSSPSGISSDVAPAAAEAGSGQVGSTAPGATRPVYSPSGAIGVRNELAEHADLITSHDADFRPRADFPQNLQPRARDSAAARDQVNGMAARLNPERLGPSPEANAGAPVVGPDNVVESGNGRTMAIGKAYDAGGAQADAYRSHLEGLGYDTSGFHKPVLIARRITPLEPDQRELFTHAANDATALRMGSAEQAAADANRITPQMLDAQNGPNLASAANRPFVGSFMNTLPAAERGALVDNGGNLSAAGMRRIQGAMAAHAYGDKGVVARAFDDPEPNVKGLAGALTDAAGPWAKMRAAVSDGSIAPEHDVTPELMQGVKLAMRARDEGQPIGELLAQRDLFQGDTSRLVTSMLTKDGDRLASRPQIEANLRTYAEEALKNSADKGLFGGAAPVNDVLKAAQAKAAKETGSGTSKLAEGPMFSDVPPPPVANYDAAAGERYQAANAFTKESHAIYGAKPIADILAEKGGRGNYKLPDSAVPGRLFGKGPAGYEHVQAFRRAVGDDGAAMHLLRDHALDDLQRFARKDDGTFDEKKLAKWRSDHSDALRAYPELSAQLESAGAASRTFTEAAAQRRDLLRSYEKSEFGRLMGASHPDEVTGIIGAALQRADRVSVFQRLTDQVRHDPVALAGLRQAVLEHIVGKSIADIESEKGSARTLKAKQFLDAYKKYHEALKVVLPDKGLGMLQRIAQMAPRATKAIEGAGKQPKGLMRYLETAAKPHEPLLERIWKPLLAMREIGELGERVGGEWGSLGGAAVGGLAIGKKAIQAIRATGARKVGDLITDALLDPEKYAALLERAPPRPDAGSAASLAYRLKSAAMYGAEAVGRTGGDAMRRVSAHIATRASRLADRADEERRKQIRNTLGLAPVARASGGSVGSDDEPVASITGEEIAPRNATNDQLREAGRRYYEANLRGTKVYNADLGKHIEFRSSKKAFSASGDPDKIRAFAALRDVLGKGKVLSSKPPYNPTVELSTKAYHTIGAPIGMPGGVRHVSATVREDTSGNLYYDHRVSEGERPHQSRPEDTEDKSGPGRADGGAVPRANIGSSADDINLSVDAPRRAAGGALGFGSSSQPFGVPTFGQVTGPMKKAAQPGRLFFEAGGTVDGDAGAKKPAFSVDEGVERFLGHLEQARQNMELQSLLATVPSDPVQRALAISYRR